MGKLDDITLGELKRLQALLQGEPDGHPYEVGENYLIRTVTNYYTGTLVAVHEHELVIENAAWIPDTGRFADALKTESFNEVEPYPDGAVIIGRGALIDCVKIKTTQRSQK